MTFQRRSLSTGTYWGEKTSYANSFDSRYEFYGLREFIWGGIFAAFLVPSHEEFQILFLQGGLLSDVELILHVSTRILYLHFLLLGKKYGNLLFENRGEIGCGTCLRNGL